MRAAALWAAAFIVGYLLRPLVFKPPVVPDPSTTVGNAGRQKAPLVSLTATRISSGLRLSDFDDLDLLIKEFVSKDPREALKWAKLNKSLNPNLERAAFLFWLQSDPAAAIGWAIANKKDYLSESALYTSLAHSGQLALAFTALDSVESPQIREILLRDLAKSASDFPSLLASFANSRPASERIIINSSIAQTMAMTGNPDDAISWARNTAQNPSELNELLGGVVSGWIKSGNTSTLLQWVNAQQPGPEMNRAYAMLSIGLANSDVGTTFASLQNISDIGLQNTAAILAMHDVRDSSPATAIEYLSVIQNSNYRDSKIEMVLQDWLIKDPAAANAYIDTSPTISNALKSKLQGPPGQSSPNQAAPLLQNPG